MRLFFLTTRVSRNIVPAIPGSISLYDFRVFDQCHHSFSFLCNSKFLFGVAPNDPATVVVSALALASVAFRAAHASGKVALVLAAARRD